jgi:membrane protease YdiL (CAAX protease family)
MAYVVTFLSIVALLAGVAWAWYHHVPFFCGKENAPTLRVSWSWVMLYVVGLEAARIAGGRWAFLLMTAAVTLWWSRRWSWSWADWVGASAGSLGWVLRLGFWLGLALAWPQQMTVWLNAGWCEWKGWPVAMNPLLAWLLRAVNPWEISWIVLLICVVAPLVEELIYRRVLWSGLRVKVSAFHATWISALLFSLRHGAVDSFLPHFLAGLVFAQIWSRTGSLLSCIVAHGTVNAVTVVVLLSDRWGWLRW